MMIHSFGTVDPDREGLPKITANKRLLGDGDSGRV